MSAKMRHDTFCWGCCVRNTTLKCSTCPRSFHVKCAKSKKRNIVNEKRWRCPICIRLESTKNSDGKERLDMLPIMISRAYNDIKFDSLKYPLKGQNSDTLINRMDLEIIKSKTYSYTSIFEFLVDVQWIVHNCLVLYPPKHVMVKTAKSLAQYLELEIESVRKCAECYSNANKNPRTMAWSTMVCEPPHIVLWAKLPGYNYWPAKVITVNKQSANVRFFGDRSEADVPANKCFLYSNTNPSITSTKPSASYRSALKEANEYIENVRQRFGSYRIAETKIPFKPALLNRYIRDLIPGAGRFRLPSIVSEDSTDGSFNAVTSPMKHQPQPEVNLSTIAEDVRMNNEAIGLVGSNQLQLHENDDLFTLNTNIDNIDSGTVNDEPPKKIARLSIDQSSKRSARNDLAISSNVESIKTEIVADPSSTTPAPAPAPNLTKGCKTPVDQSTPIEPDCSSTSSTRNMEKRQEIMESSKNSSKAFEYVCDKNAKLQNELKNVAAKYNRQIKLLESRNEQLSDELKIKTDQLASEKLKHERMISVYNQMIVRKDEEKMMAVNEAKDYARRLEANKKRTFCLACNCKAKS